MAKKSKARSPKRKAKTKKSQATRFKEAARKIDADQSGAQFESAFAKIVRPSQK